MPSAPTPRQAGHLPRKGALFIEDVVGENLRRLRGGLSQADVATRMRALGYENWSQSIVSRIELRNRDLRLREVLGLALVLGARLSDLLDAGEVGADLDFGTWIFDGDQAYEWLCGARLEIGWNEDNEPVEELRFELSSSPDELTPVERAEVRRSVREVYRRGREEKRAAGEETWRDREEKRRRQ